MTALTATISLICGCIIGTGVTLAWEWQRMRKVHCHTKSIAELAEQI